MRVPPVLPVAFIACLAASGCSTTVTLRNGSAAPSPTNTASAPAPGAPSNAVPTTAPGGPSTSAAASSVPPASGMFGPAQPAGVPRTGMAGGGPKRRITMGERMSSGMQTGSVGAFFGSFGGPIGFAAGGGTGFLVGFVAGRSPFGPVAADDASGGSWEHQVESQRVWEAQVRDQLAQLDAQGRAQGTAAIPPAQGIAPAQGMPGTAAGVPGTDALAAVGSTDPMADYEAWSRQVTAYARPAVMRTGAASAAAREAPPESDPGTAGQGSGGGGGARAPAGGKPPEGTPVQAVDSDGDGRQDAWLIRDGKTLRMHALDRNGDGRPDREDHYTMGRITSRRLDDDFDGRFETIETIEGEQIAGWVMDLDGDGRYESRSVQDAEGVHHVERDSNGDGRTDAWIMMLGEGERAAVREQVDTDGDGRADTTTIYVDGHVVKEQNITARKSGTGS